MGLFDKLTKAVDSVSTAINDGTAEAMVSHYAKRTSEELNNLAEQGKKKTQETLDNHATLKNATSALGKVATGAFNVAKESGMKIGMDGYEAGVRFVGTAMQKAKEGTLSDSSANVGSATTADVQGDVVKAQNSVLGTPSQSTPIDSGMWDIDE